MSKAVKMVVVLSAAEGDRDWPGNNAMLFADWLRGVIAEIPEEYRASATIQLDSVPDEFDEAHHSQITISYNRPETDEEREERRVAKLNEIARKLERARADVVRLEEAAKRQNI